MTSKFPPLIYLFSVTVLLIIFAVPVQAATKAVKTSSENISSAITQSYTTEGVLQQGIIVRLKANSVDTVEPLKEKHIQSMLGVIVPASASAVTLTPETAKNQQVFVATTGRYPVLVSNQNGVIEAGSLVTVSALSGIGMKADSSQSVVLGKAVTSFNGIKQVISSVKLKDQTGNETSVAIGQVWVDISITKNPLQQKATNLFPSYLVKTATSIAGKPVSPLKIYLSLAIVLIGGFVASNAVYSGVKNGMTAIGRNPLSKKSIIRSLIQVVIAGIIIFTTAVFAVYLLLKL